MNEYIIVFTDGACSNNGKITAKAGIGIYFSENDPRNMSQRVIGKQSNNMAELTAIIKVFDILAKEIYNEQKVLIVTDSEYSIRCCTTYGKKCAEINWSKDIPNKELVKLAYELANNYSNVSLKHVDAHTGRDDFFSKGNDMADKLANVAIGHTECMYNINNNNNNNIKSTKVFLKVPFEEKDNAKKYGARWDPSKKKWYYMSDLESSRKDKLIELYKI